MLNRRLESFRQVQETVLKLVASCAGCAVALYEPDSNEGIREILPPVQFEAYCTAIQDLSEGKKLCYADHIQRAEQVLKERNQSVTLCHAGVFNQAVPLVIGGEVKAVLLYGQMLVDGDERCSGASERCDRLLANLAIADEKKEYIRSRYAEIKRFSRQRLDELNQQLSLLQRLLYEMLSREEERDVHAESLVHDLQTRLQPILAQTENLYEELFGTPANHPSIEGAQTQAGNLKQSVLGMRQLIYNLGDFTPDYQFERCSLRGLIDDAMTLYWAEAERRGVDIQVVMEEPSMVRGSRLHLMQMISNLVHNAIKYSFRGADDRYRYVGIVGQIRGNRYMTRFENYGIGILPDEKNRVFERGVKGQLTSGEYRTGAGMGLAIVSEIVDRHGGKIDAYSEPQRGGAYCNRFVLHLPRH